MQRSIHPASTCSKYQLSSISASFAGINPGSIPAPAIVNSAGSIQNHFSSVASSSGFVIEVRYKIQPLLLAFLSTFECRWQDFTSGRIVIGLHKFLWCTSTCSLCCQLISLYVGVIRSRFVKSASDFPLEIPKKHSAVDFHFHSWQPVDIIELLDLECSLGHSASA